MKWKTVLTPLILLVVLLSLAGIAYWDEKKTEKDKTAEALKGKLFEFDPAEIISITVTNATAEPRTWTLVHDESKEIWSVAAPLNYRADGEGIDRLLKIILDAKSERDFDMGNRSLATFGLEPAQIIYAMKDKAGKTHTFSIGGKSPTGYSSYARKDEGNKVLLVNQYLFTATNKTLTDFRDRKLGVPPIADIKKVDVTFAGKSPIQLERADKDWRIVSPIQAAGDTLDTNKWLSSWDNLRIADFIDTPAPELLKALTVLGKGSKEVVHVRFDTGSYQKEFTVIENNGKAYARLSEQTFVELDRPSIESLRKSPKEFEDRSVFKFVSSDVTKASIDGVAYAKEKGDWVSVKDKKPMPFVQGMIVSLEFAKAESKLLPDEAEPSVKGPALHTVSIAEGDKPAVEFSLWKKVGGEDSANMLVLKTGESFYQVNAEIIDLLKPKSLEANPTLGGELKDDIHSPR